MERKNEMKCNIGKVHLNSIKCFLMMESIRSWNDLSRRMWRPCHEKDFKNLSEKPALTVNRAHVSSRGKAGPLEHSRVTTIVENLCVTEKTLRFTTVCWKGKDTVVSKIHSICFLGGRGIRLTFKIWFLSKQCEAGWASNEKQRAACHQEFS